MALITCRECGHQFSTRADACPSCGYRLRPSAEDRLADAYIKEIRAATLRENGASCLGCVVGAFKVAVVGLLLLVIVACAVAVVRSKPAPDVTLPRDGYQAPAEPQPHPDPNFGQVSPFAPLPDAGPAEPPKAAAVPKAGDADGSAEKTEPPPSLLRRAATYLKMGENLEKAGKPDAAAKYYRQVVDEFPDSPQAEPAAARLKALRK